MKTMKYLIIASALATTLGPVSVHAMNQGQMPQEAAAAAQEFTPEQVAQANRNLFNAIINHNIVGVTQALMRGANSNQATRDGETPLIRACYEGDATVVALLLSRGANANQSDQHGNIPLAMACGNDYFAIVELLLSHGANSNQAAFNGMTPLNAACMNGSTRMVTLLLDRGAHINQPGRFGDTPLGCSCSKSRHTAIVKRLAFHGARHDEDKEEISEPMRAVIKQAQEAQRNVGNQDWLPHELVASGVLARHLQIQSIEELMSNLADPVADIEDIDIQQLIKEQIIKNRERHQAAATQEEKNKENDQQSDDQVVNKK